MITLKNVYLLVIIIIVPLNGMWFDICIDPGHCGGADPGALGINGSDEPNESDFNLDIALFCQGDLTSMGWTVLLTRHDENYFPKMEPFQKAYIANGLIENDIGEQSDFCVSKAVSIHNNSNTDHSAHGTEAYYSYLTIMGYELAVSVKNGATNYLSMFPFYLDRGVFGSQFSFPGRCLCPACIIEVLFVSHNAYPNGNWYQLLEDQGGIKGFAAIGIDDGIVGLWRLHKSPCNLRLLWEPYQKDQRGSVTLIWHPTEEQNVTYSLYRREHPGSNYILVASNITDTFYTNTNLTNSTTYSFYSIATNGSQTTPRSNILTIRTPTFQSSCNLATGLNNGKRIYFDNNGIVYLSYTSDSLYWCARSNNYGGLWSTSRSLETGLSPNIAFDALNNPHIISVGSPGSPDTSSSEDTTTAIYYSKYKDGSWKSPILYSSPNSLLNISFATDPLDTGWVLFTSINKVTYTNNLIIGKFYTQSSALPNNLEYTLTLATNIGDDCYGMVGVRSTDRSLHIVYEKSGDVMYLRRTNLGNWSIPFRISIGHKPSLSVVGSLIHFTWERWDNPTKIQYCYTDGMAWSRIQTITTTATTKCYPFIEKGSIVTWHDDDGGQFEVFSSQKNMFSAWSTPQNISQTDLDSKYPQVAMYQNGSQTNLVYMWTEGNSSPYDVKLLPVTLRFDGLPFYAFDLGEKEPSVFLKHRDGYIGYGQGYEKSVDYDSTRLCYDITGLDPNKTYKLGLAFYQDENDNTWEQKVEIDSVNVRNISLPRRRLVVEKIMIDNKVYQDGIVELQILQSIGPKVVLAGFAIWEYSKENRSVSFVEEYNTNKQQGYSLYTWPNPANGKVEITYNLPKESDITIKIYSVTGQVVRVMKGRYIAGNHKLIWDVKDEYGNRVPSGIYFVRLVTPESNLVTKLVILN